MRDTIVKIMEKILDEKIYELKDDEIIPDNLENWDSLQHLSLVTAIEEEFNIILKPEEITLMNNGIKYILEILNKHGVN